MRPPGRDDQRRPVATLRGGLRLLPSWARELAYLDQGLVENIASEMSARMIAMKSATDNAGEIIKELQTVYNKARQAAITQEISEIVSGAAAV